MIYYILYMIYYILYIILYIILYYILLCYIILHCIILYYIALYYIILVCCIILHYIILYYISLYCIILYYILYYIYYLFYILYYIFYFIIYYILYIIYYVLYIIYYIPLYYIISYCIILYYIMLCYINYTYNIYIDTYTYIHARVFFSDMSPPTLTPEDYSILWSLARLLCGTDSPRCRKWWVFVWPAKRNEKCFLFTKKPWYILISYIIYTNPQWLVVEWLLFKHRWLGFLGFSMFFYSPPIPQIKVQNDSFDARR